MPIVNHRFPIGMPAAMMLLALLSACTSNSHPSITSGERTAIGSELDRLQENMLDATTKESQVRELQKLITYLDRQSTTHASKKFIPEFAWSFQVRDLVTGQYLTSGAWNDGRTVEVTIVAGTNTTGTFRQLRAMKFTLLTGEKSGVDLLYKP